MSEKSSRNTAWNLVLGYGQPSRRRRVVTVVVAILIVLLFPTVFLLNHVRQSKKNHELLIARLAAFEDSVVGTPDLATERHRAIITLIDEPPRAEAAAAQKLRVLLPLEPARAAEIDLVNLFREVTPGGENWELEISDEEGHLLGEVRPRAGLPEKPIGLKTLHRVTLFGRPLHVSRTDRFAVLDLISGPQVLIPLLATLVPLLILTGYFRRRRSFSLGEKMLDTLADVIMVVDGQYRVVYVSPSVQKRFRTLPSDIQGRPFFELFDERDRDEVQNALDMATDSEQTQPHTAHLRRAGGEGFEVEVAVRRIIVGNERVGFLVTLHDVTDLLQLSRQVEQNARVESLGRVAATIAHEFNNVLSGLQVSLDMLNRKAGDEPAVRSLSQMMKRHLAVGKNIAEGVLRFSRPAEIHAQALDVKTWIEAVAADLSASLGPSAHLVVNVTLDDAAIRGDANQLTQVITNLVLNARDASPAGSTIRIDVTRSQGGRWPFGVVPGGEYVHLVVADQGSGMPSSVMSRMFEPLFTTKQTGTGLGLAVCHQIVAAHHGLIFVSSEETKGTEFHIFFRTIAESASTSEALTYPRDQMLM